MSEITMTREELEALCETTIDPEIWNVNPWGHRLVVKRFPVQEKIGLIIVPEQAKEPPAAGWVVRVGDRVGLPDARDPGHCPMQPEELLGTHVVFGRWSGKPIKQDTKSDPSESEYVVLTEGDIWLDYGRGPAPKD